MMIIIPMFMCMFAQICAGLEVGYSIRLPAIHMQWRCFAGATTCSPYALFGMALVIPMHCLGCPCNGKIKNSSSRPFVALYLAGVSYRLTLDPRISDHSKSISGSTRSTPV